jgi:hypothetical protein
MNTILIGARHSTEPVAKGNEIPLVGSAVNADPDAVRQSGCGKKKVLCEIGEA